MKVTTITKRADELRHALMRQDMAALRYAIAARTEDAYGDTADAARALRNLRGALNDVLETTR